MALRATWTVPDPTFSDEEGRRILARAAERHEGVERARLDSGDPMTIDDLTAIAEEVDIDVSHVRAAAAELVLHRDAAPPETIMGVPKGVREVRVLPGTVSDRQWEQIVSVLRERFGADGVVARYGDVREWASPVGSFAASVKVRIEPREDGAFVTLQQSNTYAKEGRGLAVMPLRTRWS